MLLAGSSLLTLLDDIATLLDDISVMGKLAAKKTGLSAIRNEKIVTARYAGSLRNRNTPAILNRRLPSVFR